MSTWVGMAPLIGTGSLGGFAIGALMSGGCVLAITASRRARARQAPAARAGGALAAEHDRWLRGHIMTAEVAVAGALSAPGPARAFGAEAAGDFGTGAAASRNGSVASRNGSAAGRTGAVTGRTGAVASGTGAEWAANAEEPGIPGGDRPAIGHEGPAVGHEGPAAGHEGKAAGGYRSKHRRGDPLPGGASWEHGAHPGAVSPDEVLGDWASGGSKRLPRHAAPSVSFASRLAGFGSRMGSLLAPRALASGARG